MAPNEKLVLEDLSKHYGNLLAVDSINLRVPTASFVSLLGPSGCGKTTTLRMIAGLEHPSDGRIVVDGRILSDRQRVVAPERRGMGMVFQSYAVWPHLSVADNVAYGLKFKGLRRDDIAKRVFALLDLVGLPQHGDRYPSQLSGGQQQRVALARALATEPSILLLDEPLSNLDALLREAMRFEIRSLQRRLGITAIYVTHAQDEALAVSDEVVVMSEGRILQQGPPEEVYSRPRSKFVAGFIGLANLLVVTLRGRHAAGCVVELPNGAQVKVREPEWGWQSDEKALLMIRPENVKYARANEPSHSTSNTLQASVRNVSFTGSLVNYFVQLAKAPDVIRIQATPPVLVEPGDDVVIVFSPEDCLLLNA